MITSAINLLEETDTTRRVFQNVGIVGGILLVARGTIQAMLQGPSAVDIAAIVLGLAVVVAAVSIKQRWKVEYKGHSIRFENSPILAEKLFIDDQLVARGGFGYRMELRGALNNGEGRGDQIVAVSEAGLLQFRCRIFAEPATQA